LRGGAERLELTISNDMLNASSLLTFRAKLKTHFLLLHTRDEQYPPPHLCIDF